MKKKLLGKWTAMLLAALLTVMPAGSAAAQESDPLQEETMVPAEEETAGTDRTETVMPSVLPDVPEPEAPAEEEYGTDIQEVSGETDGSEPVQNAETAGPAMEEPETEPDDNTEQQAEEQEPVKAAEEAVEEDTAEEKEAKEAETEEELLKSATADIVYRTHCQDYGWLGWVKNGELAGTTGQSKRLEAMHIKLSDASVSGSVEYRTHCQDYGWLDWVRDGEETGTHGQSKRLEAIEIRLTGDMAKAFDVYYHVHCQDYGWLGWAKNGQASGSAGHSKRLEAIEIRLVRKGGPAPGSTLNVFVPEDSNSAIPLPDDNSSARIQYSTHVQNVGWQTFVEEGGMAGTTGRSLRLEGIRIVMTDPECDGSILYRTHVQNIGWQGFVQDGSMSGTEGRSLRLEAIQIKLTGEVAENYDVWYRVHCQDFGWMGWAKNGASSGTAGYAKRLEGIEIRLVNKGGAAPGSTENAYREYTAPAGNTGTASMTEANWQVLINIVGAVESGGQIYGHRDYSSYAGRYQASPYEYTCTLGWAQFFGYEAMKLIQNIYNANPSEFRKIDASGEIERMLDKDWVALRWDPSASEKKTLINLIISDIGRQQQDLLFRSEVTPLVTYCENNYTKDARAVIMYTEIAHLGGQAAANRVFGRCAGNYSTGNILAVLKWDQDDYSSNYQVGDAMYNRRHAVCAEFAERYVS